MRGSRVSIGVLAISLMLSAHAASVRAAPALALEARAPAADKVLKLAKARVEAILLKDLGRDDAAAAAAALTSSTKVPGDDPSAVWVVTRGAELPQVSSTRDGFSATVKNVAPAPSDTRDHAAGLSARSMSAVAAAKSLEWRSVTCYDRYTNAHGWFDYCTRFGKVLNDGDNVRDHWVFKAYGTCKSSSTFYLNNCKIHGYPGDNETGWQWEDWAPRGDTSGGCRSQSIGVSASGVGVSGSYTLCEKNDITKGTQAANFENRWRADVAVYQSERDVAYQVAFNVANGHSPLMSTDVGMTGPVHM